MVRAAPRGAVAPGRLGPSAVPRLLAGAQAAGACRPSPPPPAGPPPPGPPGCRARAAGRAAGVLLGARWLGCGGRGAGPRRRGGGGAARAAVARGAQARPRSVEQELRALRVASGRRVRELLRRGRVSVDGQAARDPGRVLRAGELLHVDGVELDRDPPAVLKYHKPRGVLSTLGGGGRSADLTDVLLGLPAPWDEPPELEGPERPPAPVLQPWVSVRRYHPVGRLDRDSTGLLILSSDGVLTNELLDPSPSMPRVYEVTVDGDATAVERDGKDLRQLLRDGVLITQGIFSGNVHDVRRLAPEGPPRSKVTLEVFAGKYHQVRKMLYSVGLPVLELCRVQHGELRLGGLGLGELARPSPQEARWAAELAPGRRRQQPRPEEAKPRAPAADPKEMMKDMLRRSLG